MNTNGKPEKIRYHKTRDELHRLTVAIKSSKSLSLHFLFNRDPNLAKKIIKSAKAPVKIVKLPKKGDVLEKIARDISTSVDKQILFVPEFDEHLKDENGTYCPEKVTLFSDMILSLRNLQRAVLMSISLDFILVLQEFATEVWDWRSGLYTFNEQEDDRYNTAGYLCDHLANLSQYQHHHSKLLLRNLYETILAEYLLLPASDRYTYEYHGLGKLARVRYGLGDYSGSAKDLHRQLELAESFGDEKLLMQPLNNLGFVRHNQGQFEDAKLLLQRASDLAESLFRGNNHPCHAIIISNLSCVHQEMGEYKDAFLQSRAAVRMSEHTLGTRHQKLIPVLSKQGDILRLQGKLEDSLDVFRRVLHIIEKKLDLEDAYISATLQNIGLVYFMQGKYEDAKRYYYRTMEATENFLGSEHPHLAVQLRYVGLVHFYLEEVSRALKYLFWAVELRQEQIGHNDPMIGDIYVDIGQVYQHQNDLHEAQMCYQRALDIYHTVLPQDHPKTQALVTYFQQLETESSAE